MDPDTFQVGCVAVGDGHAKAVNTVAFSRSVVWLSSLFLDFPGDVEPKKHSLIVLYTIAFCFSFSVQSFVFCTED